MNKTQIEWAGMTWNPVTGCTPVDDGCRNCYAERAARRMAGRCGYPKAPNHFDVTLRHDRLTRPLQRKKPTTVFVCSMGDLFHKAVDYDFILSVFKAMVISPQHTFMILTKRAERMYHFINMEFKYASIWRKTPAGGWPPPNVWFGVSAGYHDLYLTRTHWLMNIPGNRFVSIAPCLGPFHDMDLQGIGLVIVEGESGPGARPTDPNWVRGIRDRCVADRVPFCFKQWGEWLPVGKVGELPIGDNETVLGETVLRRVGKSVAGRILDGRTWDEVPDG